MALGISWECARAKLGAMSNSKGYFPHEVAAAVGGEIDRYDWSGPLDRCIVQVIIEPNGPPKHFVWIDGGLWCPAAHCDRWTRIHGFGQVVRVPLPIASGLALADADVLARGESATSITPKAQ